MDLQEDVGDLGAGASLTPASTGDSIQHTGQVQGPDPSGQKTSSLPGSCRVVLSSRSVPA